MSIITARLSVFFLWSRVLFSSNRKQFWIKQNFCSDNLVREISTLVPYVRYKSFKFFSFERFKSVIYTSHINAFKSSRVTSFMRYPFYFQDEFHLYSWSEYVGKYGTQHSICNKQTSTSAVATFPVPFMLETLVINV